MKKRRAFALPSRLVSPVTHRHVSFPRTPRLADAAGCLRTHAPFVEAPSLLPRRCRLLCSSASERRKEKTKKKQGKRGVIYTLGESEYILTGRLASILTEAVRTSCDKRKRKAKETNLRTRANEPRPQKSDSEREKAKNRRIIASFYFCFLFAATVGASDA